MGYRFLTKEKKCYSYLKRGDENMKKTILTLTILFLIPGLVLAQGKAQGQGNGVQQQLGDPAMYTDDSTNQVNQYQNVNQVQQQNMGEETQIQNQNQFAEQEGEATQTKGGVNRSENAKVKMSAVAQKVQELLNDPNLEGGIGPQIREFAQDQHQVQNELESTQNRLTNRNQFTRVVLGPDYKALKNMEQLYERNQIRIQTLTELANEVQDEVELAQITETVALLTEQNTALAEQIAAEEAQPGILGWFFRLFAK